MTVVRSALLLLALSSVSCADTFGYEGGDSFGSFRGGIGASECVVRSGSDDIKLLFHTHGEAGSLYVTLYRLAPPLQGLRVGAVKVTLQANDAVTSSYTPDTCHGTYNATAYIEGLDVHVALNLDCKGEPMHVYGKLNASCRVERP